MEELPLPPDVEPLPMEELPLPMADFNAQKVSKVAKGAALDEMDQAGAFSSVGIDDSTMATLWAWVASRRNIIGVVVNHQYR